LLFTLCYFAVCKGSLGNKALNEGVGAKITIIYHNANWGEHQPSISLLQASESLFMKKERPDVSFWLAAVSRAGVSLWKPPGFAFNSGRHKSKAKLAGDQEM